MMVCILCRFLMYNPNEVHFTVETAETVSSRIRTEFNIHFIFTTMLAIQHFFLKERERDAVHVGEVHRTLNCHVIKHCDE